MSYTTFVGHKRPNLGSVINGTMDYAESSMGFRPVTGNDGGCMVVKQQFQKKSTSGRRRTLAEKMRLHYMMSQNSLISRWQALTLYNSNPAALTLKQDFVTGPPASVTLPMFCFNLTSMPINGVNETGLLSAAGVRIETFPAYTLKKTLSPSTVYQWTPISQVHGSQSGAAASTAWDIEWDTINGTPPTTVNQYTVDWAKAKFVFKGAAKRPVKLHTALCSFKHPGVGPLRQYYDGTSINLYDNTSTDQVEDGALYWDNFWAARVSNPIRTSRRPDNYNLSKPCRMWNHESFVLGEDVSINNDPLPLQATYSRFIRMDKPMRTVQPLVAYSQSNNVIAQNVAAGGSAFGYVGAQKTAGNALSGVAFTQGPYPQYNKDVYLVVWADVYDQSTGGTYADGSLVTDVCPSFDINLEAKYSYND